jgi:hypothetical protein
MLGNNNGRSNLLLGESGFSNFRPVTSGCTKSQTGRFCSRRALGDIAGNAGQDVLLGARDERRPRAALMGMMPL